MCVYIYIYFFFFKTNEPVTLPVEEINEKLHVQTISAYGRK